LRSVGKEEGLFTCRTNHAFAGISSNVKAAR